MSIRILIADDDPNIRLLLRRLLEKQQDWHVCGEASNGVEAIEGVEQFAPDIVVMDLAMPVMNGLQAAPEIMKTHPQLPMLLILNGIRNHDMSSKAVPNNLSLDVPERRMPNPLIMPSAMRFSTTRRGCAPSTQPL